MRIPIFVVVIASVLVIGGGWYYGVRGMDFLKQPTPEELLKIRLAVESSIPVEAQSTNAVASPVKEVGKSDVSNEPAKPIMELGDFAQVPAIFEYRDQAGKGVGYLIELAEYLEGQKQLQRALLVWERVIDSSKPSLEQWDKAVAEVKRLRAIVPPLNQDSRQAIGVVLQAGVAKRAVPAIKTALDEVAKSLEQASSGVLRVQVVVTAGDNPPSRKSPVPVALWLNGEAKQSRSSEMVSFVKEEQTDLPKEITRSIYEAVRATLVQRDSTMVLPELLADAEGADALTYWLTRGTWVNFAKLLNSPAEKPMEEAR